MEPFAASVVGIAALVMALVAVSRSTRPECDRHELLEGIAPDWG